MRTIKFRGMSINGSWSYGLPCIITKGRDIGSYISNSCGVPMAYEIRPETLTQFTGLLDKHGKEIFEGDIVKGGYEYEDCFCDLIEEVKFCDCYFTPFGGWFGNGSGSLYSCSIDPKNFEIIGNIHQTPELLKG